jgi:membrane-associated phospholipid phosphatase
MKVVVETRTPAPSHRAAHRERVSVRVVVFWVVLGVYALLTIGVLFHSPLLTLDQDVLRLDLRQRHRDWFYPVHTFVMLGQRGPATLVALPWFAWRAWKSRSPRPFIMLGAALVLLNLSVGFVKVATGRLGPSATHHAYSVFEGGDIYPSGHVSNAVVLYGVIAMLAVGHRRAVAAAAVTASLAIGLSTIYLDTHWLTDVLGGWLAGCLVLLALPSAMPYAEWLYYTLARYAKRAWIAVRPRPESILPRDALIAQIRNLESGEARSAAEQDADHASAHR